MSKEEVTEIMMQIMKAIKETMTSGEANVLIFGDAKITIEALQKDDEVGL